MTKKVAAAVLVPLFALAGTGTATATIKMQKQAKDAGVAVQNCMLCHTDKLPKKGAATLNDRGKWLEAEKTRRAAKEVDGAWLKEFKEKK